MDLSLDDAELAFADEVRRWMAEHFEAPPVFASVEEEVEWGRRWQAKLAAAGWVGLDWPAEHGGRGVSPTFVALFNLEYARAGGPPLVNRGGLNLVGPTLLAYGTEAQRRRWLPSMLSADEIWCQLFSEPGAGSDLASLTTRAEPVEDGWVLNGQKVWTSYAGFADWGICLARTDRDQPRHRGLSMLAVDMRAPGIGIRPLLTMTGDADFNEVFLDDVFVPADAVVGGLGEGWAVANTTLAHERGTSFPFREQAVHEVWLDELWRLACAEDRLDDVAVRAALVDTFVSTRVLRLHNDRTLSRLAKGTPPGPESSIVKLAWSSMSQQLSSTALELLGPSSPLAGKWARQWLWSHSTSIAGGTTEVQRTIIGERLLGLPRS